MSDEDEARRLLDSIGVTPIQEAAGAVKEMVDALVEQGFTIPQALFWSAVHVANLKDEEDGASSV